MTEPPQGASLIRWHQHVEAFPKTRAVRVAKCVALGLVAMEVLYVIAANAILAGGMIQKLVNDTESAHLEIGSSYTLIPMRIHAVDLRLRYQDHNMQFAFSIAEADVTVRLSWLFRKRFSASEVRATGVRFLFRHKVAQVAGNEAALASYPSIAGFSDPPILGVPNGSDPQQLWSFELDDVDAQIRELWFMSYRYVGPAEATGGFQLSPYQNLEVGPAHLSLRSGVLYSGEEKVLSHELRGEVEVHLVPVNPEALTGMATFASISAVVRLNARLEDLDPVNLYLPEASHVRVSGGGGNLEVAARLQAGKLAAESVLTYTALSPLRAATPTLSADVPLQIRLSVARGGAARLSLNAERLGFSSLRLPATDPDSLATAEHAQLLVELSEIDLTRAIAPNHARLEVPALAFGHLERLDAMVPGKRSWHLLGGAAKWAGVVDLFDSGVTHAILRADFEALQLKLREHEMWAYGTLAGGYGSNGQSAQLEHVELMLSHVAIRSENRRSANWWASVRADRVPLSGPPNELRTGTIVVNAKNADPVLNALDVPGIIRMLVPNKPVEATAKLERYGDVLRLESIQAKTGSLVVKGEVRRESNRTSGVFGVEGVAIPFGIELKQKKPEVTLFVSNGWLEEHLQSLEHKPQGSVALH